MWPLALGSRALLNRSLLGTALKVKCQPKRNGGHGTWTYRSPPPPPSQKSVRLAEVIGGLCWYWILYHIVTEPDHIIGEWTYIHPHTWTDEELGIPPDSEGSLCN